MMLWITSGNLQVLLSRFIVFTIIGNSLLQSGEFLLKIFDWKFRETKLPKRIIICTASSSSSSRYLNSRNFFRQIMQASNSNSHLLKTLGFFFEGNPPLLLFSWVNYHDKWKIKKSLKTKSFFRYILLYSRKNPLTTCLTYIFSYLQATLGRDNHAYF